MKLSIRELELREREAAPGRIEAMLRARVRLEDGREAEGFAAEHLVPGWFDPALGDEQGMEQLRASLQLARDACLVGGEKTAFEHSLDMYGPQLALGAARGFTNLVACLGPALVDRAVLDALCRALEISFAEAIRRNVSGLAAPGWQADLLAFDMAGFLSRLAPRRHVAVRRTLRASELPERLEGRWFKVVLDRDARESFENVVRLAEALDRRDRPYEVTLDADEQFAAADDVLDFWRSLKAERRLSRFVSRVAFLAQPIRRSRALEVDLSALAEEVALVLDAAEDSLEAFPRARRLGYTGVTLRTAKGVYKGIMDAARCAYWNGEQGTDRYFVCAETFPGTAGLALQQQVELASLLGLAHLQCGASEPELTL